MSSITSSDPRKSAVVAAMEAKLGCNTRLTMIAFDKATDTFTGHAPSLRQNVSVLASEVPGLPEVKKVVLVAKFSVEETPAAIIAFVREYAVKQAADYKIHTCWLETTPYNTAMDFSSDYQLLHSCGTTNSQLAEYLGLSQARTMTILNKMIAAGQLFGMKLTWGMTVLHQDADFRAALTNTILTNPRLS